MNTLTERLVIGGAALVVGAALGWLARGPLSYNMATQTVTTYQDWRTACPPAELKDQPCQMVEDVLDDKGQSQIARVAISREDGKMVLGLTLPFGVALQPGAGVALDKNPVKTFPYRTCNNVGCIAVLTLDDKTEAELNAATSARILIAGLDGKPVGIPISLKGYADAARAYHREEAKRASWFWRMWS